jgi:molecular chaperone GrpE (heat shock protein)
MNVNANAAPRVPKWPFLLADLLLLGMAGLIVYQSAAPLLLWHGAVAVGAVALAAWLCVLPFVLEHRAALRLAEAGQLVDSVRLVNNLDLVSEQIDKAATEWQAVQKQAMTSAEVAKAVAEQLSAETQALNQTLRSAQDQDRAHLRLEIEKLRRAEGEWLQIVVRILDHVFALHAAAARSRMANLIEQLGQFQHACRDIVRRAGLTPFVPQPGEVFDARRHRTGDGQGSAPVGSYVAETMAPGYTYQGELLRPALVVVRPPQAESAEAVAAVSDAAVPV